MNFSCQFLATRFWSHAERLPRSDSQVRAENEDTIEIPRSPVDQSGFDQIV